MKSVFLFAELSVFSNVPIFQIFEVPVTLLAEWKRGPYQDLKAQGSSYSLSCMKTCKF